MLPNCQNAAKFIDQKCCENLPLYGVYGILIDVVVVVTLKKVILKCIFCAWSAHMIDYGHFEHKNFRTRLFSMPFFVNLLIYQKTNFQRNGINKRGPEYLKNWFRYFSGFKKKTFFVFFSGNWKFWKFKEYHLVLKICQCEQLGEQKYSAKCTYLKIWFFLEIWKIIVENALRPRLNDFVISMIRPHYI